ncbi:MAG: GNAT family N-acetyltransferase [Nitrospinae bacterium]|nr:GNAT family N-acetyltransferase [Nitrospinota bacterium]
MVLQCACWDVFRELGKSDIPTIVSILADAAQVYEEEVAAQLMVTAEEVAAEMERGARYFGSEMTGDLVAVCAVEEREAGFTLTRLGVLPPLQGFGVGGMLVRDLIKEVAKECPLTVRLPEALAGLQAWFERMGVGRG